MALPQISLLKKEVCFIFTNDFELYKEKWLILA